MEEKQYTFMVCARVVYVGVVGADTIEEAKEKCFNGDYDDIIDQYESEIDWDTLSFDEREL